MQTWPRYGTPYGPGWKALAGAITGAAWTIWRRRPNSRTCWSVSSRVRPSAGARTRTRSKGAYGYWRDKLGARMDALNQPIRINGNSFTIAGLAPQGFNGPTLGV